MESQLNVLTELDGTNGFVLEGAAAGDLSGMSIAEAGVSLRCMASPLILSPQTTSAEPLKPENKITYFLVRSDILNPSFVVLVMDFVDRPGH